MILTLIYVALSECLLLPKKLQETGDPDITASDVRGRSRSARFPLLW